MRSQDIHKLEKTYIAKTQKIPYVPISFVRGEGALLYDGDGKEYIDFLASASSANLGHGNQVVAEAVYRQMQDLPQYTMAYFNTEAPILLAQKLAELAPFEDTQVLYSTTGSASIDAAIKLARAYTGRPKIISMYESYHGSSYGAISVSALSTNMRRKIGPLLPEIEHFHYPGPDFSLEACKKEAEYAFNHYIPAEEVAAILIEPIAGDAGMVIPPREWLEWLRQLCDDHGMLLICDDIQQGMWRTGTFLSMDHFGVQADLYVLGKSFGGGLPLGGVLGPADIMQCLAPPAHLFTLAGSAAVCAGALANIEELEKLQPETMVAEKGAYLKDKFDALKDKYHIIGEIRQIGLTLGVDIRKPDDPTAIDYDTTARICYRATELGLVMIFVNQSTLRVQPPLVISYEQMDKAMEIIDQAIADVVAGNVSDDIFQVMQGW